MGREIVYCARCATRILGADFERGKAFRAGGKVICAACLPTLSPEEQQQASLSSTRIKAPESAPQQGSSLRNPPIRTEPSPPASPKPLVLIIGAGALLALLGLFVVASRKSGAPEPASPEPAPLASVPVQPAPASVEKPEDPVLREAREAVEKARTMARMSPDDLDAQASAWEEALRRAGSTPFQKEASAKLQQVREKRAQLRPPPKEPERAPVVAPTPPPPAPKPVSPEQAAFRSRWDAAMAKASARDFDGAIADLGRAAAEIGDEELRKAARDDLLELQRARTILGEAHEALSRLAPGRSVSLLVRSDTGAPKQVEGSVVRAGGGRVELRQAEGTVYVEADEARVGSLGRLLGERNDADRRALAVLCLLEGDRPSAEQLSAPDALAARFWEYAALSTATAPRPAPREAEVRSRFYAAEREFQNVETMVAAILKYKSLLSDSADTNLVKSERARIQKRAEAGRDYVLVAGALKGSGTFSLSPALRTEVAWISKADAESNQKPENYVEAEFAALPEVVYRAWALVGGCCAETFTFYLQTTDGTETNPKTKKKESIDPGAGIAAPVRHTIFGLKKTHEEHRIKGAKSHPKTPARWEWVPIPLPPYSAAGVKKIRLLSDQQGFAVAAVVVSSTRMGPVPEAELREEVSRVRAPYVSFPAGLVGWWRFEEGAGTVAQNSAEGGRAGELKGKPTWTDGKIGGGLRFDSAGDEVYVTTRQTFRTITLSAWVKHDAFSLAIQRYVTIGGEAAVIRCNGNRSLHFYIRTDGELRFVEVPDTLEQGRWTLVTGTWDGAVQKLYKDGVLIASASPGGSLNGDAPRVSISSGGEHMSGVIDEVRVYDRALSEAEVQKLFAEGSRGTAAENPAPPSADARPWRPLFDGSSLGCLRNTDRGWRVVGGGIVNVPGVDDAAQTQEEFSDGELRVRFEIKDSDGVWFTFRELGSAGYRATLDGPLLKSLEGKPHELVFVGKGDKVQASLDGKPASVSSSAPSKSGVLQFNVRSGQLRILSLDVR